MNNIEIKYYNNDKGIIMGFCLHHGITEFYKNGKCKECVKYDKLCKLRETIAYNKSTINYLKRIQK